MTTAKTKTRPKAGPAGQPPRETKLEIVRRLLARKNGADLAALQDATGWQPHSVRAALSGLRKAGYSLERTTSKPDGGVTIYRITAAPEIAA
jgi:hypothetical protein